MKEHPNELNHQRRSKKNDDMQIPVISHRRNTDKCGRWSNTAQEEAVIMHAWERSIKIRVALNTEGPNP